jgi:hypothetical protein
MVDAEFPVDVFGLQQFEFFAQLQHDTELLACLHWDVAFQVSMNMLEVAAGLNQTRPEDHNSPSSQ